MSPHLPLRISILQPRPSIAPILDELVASGSAKLSAVELAHDFVVDDLHTAAQLQAWIAKRFAPRLADAGQGVGFESTTYFGRRRRGPHRTWCVYSDRASKIVDAPACHLELRVNGASRIRAVGIRSVADAFACASSSAWWSKRLTLYDVDLERLGRLIDGRPRARSQAFEHACTGATLFACADDRLDRLVPLVKQIEKSPSRVGKCAIDRKCLKRIVNPFAGVALITVATSPHIASDRPIKPRGYIPPNNSSHADRRRNAAMSDRHASPGRQAGKTPFPVVRSV